MIDLSLSALAKAWVTTVIASGLLLIALSMQQAWNRGISLQDLREALQRVADDTPPFVDYWN